MHVFPFWLKAHHDSLLAAFERTGHRLLDHPSFPVFTAWCAEHAEDLGLHEPTEQQFDAVRLSELGLDDASVRCKRDLACDIPITDDMRLSFITDQVLDAFNSSLEPICLTPADVMVLGGVSKGVASLGFRYLGQDHGAKAFAWEGLFESLDTFRLWLRRHDYVTDPSEILRLSEKERLAWWTH